MKPEILVYWATTGLLAAMLFAGGSAQLAAVPQTVAGIQELGFPVYLLKILGTWKLLGAITLLAPRLRRLKEWAYAGVFFDLSGAVASHALSGDAAGGLTPFMLLVLAAASWRLRPGERSWRSAPLGVQHDNALHER
jgi:hypothetical protein